MVENPLLWLHEICIRPQESSAKVEALDITPYFSSSRITHDTKVDQPMKCARNVGSSEGCVDTVGNKVSSTVPIQESTVRQMGQQSTVHT